MDPFEVQLIFFSGYNWMETRYRWAKLGVLLTLVTFDILQASITANYAENLGLEPKALQPEGKKGNTGEQKPLKTNGG